MTIPSTTLLRDIDLDKLPTTTTLERLVMLPGAPPLAHPSPKLPENKITFSQQLTDARWAKANLPESMAWGEACGSMRRKFLRANDPDFRITDGIFDELRQENKGNELTARQLKTVSEMVSALSEITPHWCAEIQSNITKQRRIRPAAVERALERWEKVADEGTNGNFNKALLLSNATFGNVPMRAAIGGPAGFEGLEVGESVENTGEEAPY